ncbi:MAG: uroporphyrin-III C-methyltransferase [Betaproteobacteria bacterium]
MTLLHASLTLPRAESPAPVTLVGAGPGDPELLTMKAYKAIGAARLVLYDHLVSQDVLELVPQGAECVLVGKKPGQHTLRQEDIIELMRRLAWGGRPVLRLKGGDPYLFGRGGEEVEALAAYGIPVRVIPGISAAQGAAACSGIPLTHRDHATTLVFATGHRRGVDGPCTLDLDWATLARPRQTVVIYMGVVTLPLICAQLIAHGLSPDTPAAIVERATLPEQRTLVGQIQTLPSLAQACTVRPPALIIIGDVVALHALTDIAPLADKSAALATLS